MISDRDGAFYHEYGYLVVPGVLERSQGSIYENQSDASRRYFGVAPESADAART
jgi:hypothetical protein